MEKRIRWINHKEKKILLTDFHGLEGAALLDLVDTGVAQIIWAGKNDMLVLINVSKADDSKVAQLKFIEAAKRIRPYCKKTAVVGLTIIKSAVMNVINQITGIGAKGFKTETEAKAWLAAD